MTNDDGGILDLSPSGNKHVGTLDDVMDDALNEEIDPATVVVQQVIMQQTPNW